MKHNLLIELFDVASNRRLVLEDDSRTAYAYLYSADQIVSAVWLYNRDGERRGPD